MYCVFVLKMTATDADATIELRAELNERLVSTEEHDPDAGADVELVASDDGVAGHDDLEGQLQTLALAIRPSLVVKSVRGDGNCLFRSIGEHTIGEDNHVKVRSICVETVANDLHTYESYFDDSNTSAEWLTSMAEQSTWGDGICISAAVNYFQRPVIVSRSGSEAKPAIFVPRGWTMNMEAPIYIEFSGETLAEHFNPLIAQPSAETIRCVQQAMRPALKRSGASTDLSTLLGDGRWPDASDHEPPSALVAGSEAHTIAGGKKQKEEAMKNDHTAFQEVKWKTGQGHGKFKKESKDS